MQKCETLRQPLLGNEQRHHHQQQQEKKINNTQNSGLPKFAMQKL